jgi:transcriptional regulator with PAS, ATPase and Fis domain
MAGARLIVHGPDGTAIDLTLDQRTTLGRAAGNDVVLDDPGVSRKHAILELRDDGRYAVNDLGSANGTYLNDRRLIVPATLRGGDVVRLGSTLVTFVEDTEEAVDILDSFEEATAAGKERPSEPVLLGTGQAMSAVFRLIEKAAASPIAVLIEGETGTGKELIARGIHFASERSSAPFLAVNCAALPETLLESELFGSRRGAYTGATHDRRGLFEAADGGTIFLDEVGEMPVAMQPKLLRVLQEGQITPIGDTRPHRVDVRVISATNRDLAAEVAGGNFREDLYYRLAAFPIHVPSLRDRREDIPLLAERMLAVAAQRHHKRVRGIDPLALEALLRFDWPGNVRELENELQRAVALALDGETIGLAHLSSRLRGESALAAAAGAAASSPGAASGAPAATHRDTVDPEAARVTAPLRAARGAFEAQYIAEVLRRESGNVARAAQTLGLSRAALHKKLKEYGLR